MKATKDRISLETAMMLKDCEIESKSSYVFVKEILRDDGSYYVYNLKKEKVDEHTNIIAPAFTWVEILWEYAEKFFGSEIISNAYPTINDKKKYYYITKYILNLLQQKKYEEADLYFRENCILIV